MKIHQELTKIVYDTSAIDYIKLLAPKSVCLTSDPFMIKLGVLRPFEQYFVDKGIPYKVFSDVQPNPSEALVRKGLLHIIETKPDVIIAIGGGSAIDLAKAIMYYCIHIKTEFMSIDSIQKPLFIAVPTTSGTGSEITNYTVITDEETGAKRVIQSELMQPDVAILDVDLTMSAPGSITADTGVDALTHALEAYVSKLRTPFSDAYALKAIDLIFKNLIPAYENGNHKESRQNMQIAATLAGLAFNHSGLGINHSIAHSLGAIFHLPHGKANALVLPEVMKFNLKSQDVIQRYDEIARYLGMNFGTPEINAKALIEGIHVLKSHLGQPNKLSVLDINMNAIIGNLPQILSDVKADYCTASHPFVVTDEDIRGIVMALV
jgi:alcohol dehydrogenase class IV